jgi:hypothetical protein
MRGARRRAPDRDVGRRRRGHRAHAGGDPRPEWLVAPLYVLLGRVGAAALRALGAAPARHRGRRSLCPQAPDPVSAVFGYHEVFHVLVIAAAALQYAAIAFFVLPGARE